VCRESCKNSSGAQQQAEQQQVKCSGAIKNMAGLQLHQLDGVSVNYFNKFQYFQ